MIKRAKKLARFYFINVLDFPAIYGAFCYNINKHYHIW